MQEDELFYIGLKAFIKKADKLLILFDLNNGLDFPGGKVVKGETDFTKSLRREVDEETGLAINVFDPFVTWHYTFGKDHKNAGKTTFLVGYRCEYRSGKVALSDEHIGYKWCDKNTYQKYKENTLYYKALEKYFKTYSKEEKRL